MKHKLPGMIALLFLALLMIVPSSTLGAPLAKEQTPSAEQAQWKKKMQSLYQSLTDLLTDVCSDQRYNDSKNSSRIEREIKSISAFSHELSKKTKDTIQADPSLQLFSGFLASETSEAYRSFRGGQKDYARDILRAIPGDCLACHSRNTLGPDFKSLPLEPNAPLKPFGRATFYAATRQFDRAIESFQKVLRGEEKPKADPYDLEKSVHDAFTIAVRFKRDPVLTQSIAQSVLDNADAPQFLKENASLWKKSAAEWQSEKPREAKTEEGLHAEALRLMAQAKAHQGYSMDHSQDSVYLRASSVLYDLIQMAPNGKYVGDALLLLGVCYEVLSPRRMENLHNIYYEACIDRAPHTDTSKTCYQRYEQSMYFGFTGSSGTHLPSEIKQKLLELWAKAIPTKGDL